MREFIEFDIPGVGRGRTEFGINPANANEPVYVRINQPDAPPETLTFADHPRIANIGMVSPHTPRWARQSTRR